MGRWAEARNDLHVSDEATEAIVEMVNRETEAWNRQDADAQEDRWCGRVCKVYALCDGEWKITMHTGVLRY